MKNIGIPYLRNILLSNHLVIGNLNKCIFINGLHICRVYKTTVSEYSHKYPHFNGLSKTFIH